MKNKNLISEAIANGYNFNIGNYISRGMDIFKRIQEAILVILYCLLLFL